MTESSLILERAAVGQRRKLNIYLTLSAPGVLGTGLFWFTVMNFAGWERSFGAPC